MSALRGPPKMPFSPALYAAMLLRHARWRYARRCRVLPMLFSFSLPCRVAADIATPDADTLMLPRADTAQRHAMRYFV